MKKSATQRKQEILSRIRQGLNDSTRDLAELFSVSIMTIHRDLKQLDKDGYLDKESRSVTLNGHLQLPLTQSQKSLKNAGAKSAIGQFAASNLIDLNADSIIVDSGSTTLSFIGALPDTPINIMVNNLSAMILLATYQKIQVYGLGGRLSDDSSSFEGSIAFDMLRNCHFTKAFLGADGVDLKTGITTTNTANAQLTRLMADQADEVYILTDLSKFNHRALASVMPLDGITGIVTEKGVPLEYRNAFEEKKIQLFEI